MGACGGSFPFLALLLTLSSGAMVITTETCAAFSLLPWGSAVLPAGTALPQPWLALVLLRCGGDSLLTLVWVTQPHCPRESPLAATQFRPLVTSPSSCRAFMIMSWSFLYFMRAESPGLGHSPPLHPNRNITPSQPTGENLDHQVFHPDAGG